jgi:hypothetical protein
MASSPGVCWGSGVWLDSPLPGTMGALWLEDACQTGASPGPKGSRTPGPLQKVDLPRLTALLLVLFTMAE